jgi:DNA-directed RNA polymerase beta' subunit
MSLNNILEYTSDVREVSSVQFGLLSSEDIIKQSVVEVSQPLNSVDQKTINSILDPRFGVTEKNGELCPCCKQTSLFCPGHYGFLRLAKPVVQTQFLNIAIKKVLKCVCYKCSALLYNKNDAGTIQNILTKSEKNRFNFVVANKNPKMVCPVCKAKQPETYKTNTKDPNMLGKIIATFKIRKESVEKVNEELETATGREGGEEEEANEGGAELGDEDYEARMEQGAQRGQVQKKGEKKREFKKRKPTDVKTVPIVLDQEKYHNILSQISDEDCELLGFNHKFGRPDRMVWTVMPIPPISIRPSVSFDGGKMSADDLTIVLNSIVKANVELQKLLVKAENSDNDLTEDAKNKIESVWTKLQYHIATYINNEQSSINPAINRSGRPLNTVTSRLKAKKGRVRGNLMGKRVDKSGRSVGSPDVGIDIDELGVPLKIASTITYPEVVNVYNFDKLKKLVERAIAGGTGMDNYPSAVMIKKKGGDADTRVRRYPFYKNSSLDIGDVVFRHLMNGDIVLFNRQPSLHSMSMMAHRVRVFPTKTLRLNVSVTTPYNADFDGDEMNIHVPQYIRSQYELMQLSAVHKHFVDPQASQPLLGVVQDGIVGMYTLTRNLARPIDIVQAQQILGVSEQFIGGLRVNRNLKDYSCRSVVSSILPNITTRKKNDMGKFEIVNGVMTHGQFAKTEVGAGKKGSVFHLTYLDHGSDRARDLLNDFTRVSSAWLLYDGLSVGLGDIVFENCVFDKQTPDEENETQQLNDKLTQTKRQKTSNMTPEQKQEHRAKLNEIYNQLKEINITRNQRAKQVIKSKVENMYVEADKLTKKLYTGELIKETNLTRQNVITEFESQMGMILRKADSDIASYIVKHMTKNRIMSIIDSGSKGDKSNLKLILGFLGQQDVDKERVPLDFDGRRPSPYTYKDVVAPNERGFISNSYEHGLSPTEYCAAAKAGRISVISTAIRTADTGYIQRKLIKVSEDAKVHYDGSVRNANSVMIETVYGGDGFNPIRLESSILDIIGLRPDELLTRYGFNKEYIDNIHMKLSKPAFDEFRAELNENKPLLLDELNNLINIWKTYRLSYSYNEHDEHFMSIDEFDNDWKFKKVFDNYDKTSLNSEPLMLPVNIHRLIDSIIERFGLKQRVVCDLNPFYVINTVNDLIRSISVSKLSFVNQCTLYQLYSSIYSYISARRIIDMKMDKYSFDYLINQIKVNVYKGISQSGTMCGIIAAHSIGEPTTQMTLDTFHMSGVSEKSNVSRGVPRVKEILSIAQNPSTPSLLIGLDFNYLYSQSYYMYIKTQQTIIDAQKQKMLENDTDVFDKLSDSDINSRVIGELMSNNANINVKRIMSNLEHTSIKDVLTKSEIIYDDFQIINGSIQSGISEYINDFQFIKEYYDNMTYLLNSEDVRMTPTTGIVIHFFKPYEIGKDTLTIKSHGQLSNWFYSQFNVAFGDTTVTFKTMEQFIMYYKAGTFDDIERLNDIMAVDFGNGTNLRLIINANKEITRHGREIQNFDADKWNAMLNYGVTETDDEDPLKNPMVIGLLEKFKQNDELRDLMTNTYEFAHGFVEDNPSDMGITQGSYNLLGKYLLIVKNQLVKEKQEQQEQPTLFSESTQESEFTKDETRKFSTNKWVVRLTFDASRMVEHDINMANIKYALDNVLNELDTSFNYGFIYSDNNSDRSKHSLVMRIYIMEKDIHVINQLSDMIDMIANIKIKGIPRIEKCYTSEKTRSSFDKFDTVVQSNEINKEIIDLVKQKNSIYLDTDGTNMIDVVASEFVNPYTTRSNDIIEVYEILGIEGARNAIIRELNEVLSNAGAKVSLRHIKLLADIMTRHGILTSVDRHGTSKSDNGPLAQLSFEEISTKVAEAGVFSKKDNMNGVSGNVMFGQYIKCGTNGFDVCFDETRYDMSKSENVQRINAIQREMPKIEKDYASVEQASSDYCNPVNFDFETQLF